MIFFSKTGIVWKLRQYIFYQNLTLCKVCNAIAEDEARVKDDAHGWFLSNNQKWRNNAKEKLFLKKTCQFRFLKNGIINSVFFKNGIEFMLYNFRMGPEISEWWVY